MPICTKCNDVCSKKHEPQRAAQKRAYYQANKEIIDAKRRAHYAANKERILARGIAYAAKTKEKKAATSKVYRQANKELIKSKNKLYQKERRKTDKLYNVAHSVRRRLREILSNNNWNKNTKFSQYIGCTNEEFLHHIESQFTEGMSWDNRAEWDLDHIMPISSAKDEEQLYDLCHYLNIKPLWKLDNKKKSNKITEDALIVLAKIKELKNKILTLETL
jgi:hypothetical protein